MKNSILLLVLIISITAFSQQIDFNSPQNIKLFADHLYCEKDYLRAIDEYEKYAGVVVDDTIQFKIALGFSLMNNHNSALRKLELIKKTSGFYESSRLEKLKIMFLQNSDSLFYLSANEMIVSNSIYSCNANKLLNTYLLLYNSKIIEKDNFLNPFDEKEKTTLNLFYESKINPSYKSELIAGMLSTIIPGAGKIYTQEYGDGITAFLLTGLFSYLAYTNFSHDHYTRAWIFTALGAGFYGGNIYGSIASAQIFNAKVNFDFENGLKLFLEDKNYFTPTYDFCK